MRGLLSSPRLLSLVLCCGFLLLSGWCADAGASPVFQTDEVALTFFPTRATQQVRLQFTKSHLSYIQSWEVAKITPTLFHLRHATWSSYWQVDTEKKSVIRGNGGHFGKSIASGERVDNVEVSVSKDNFILGLKSATVAIDNANCRVEISLGEDVVVDTPELETILIAPGVVQFRITNISTSYFQYDVKDPFSLKLLMPDNEFGKKIKSYINVLPVAIRPVSDSLAGNGASGVLGDVSFAGNTLPDSLWIDNEKAAFYKVLASRQYDILVVPFQVSGYAVDRISRALMTQMLTAQLQDGRKETVADSLLVSKALGAQLRTFDSFDVYRLANELKVKTIVWCYAGHNLDLKLDLSFRVQQRETDLFSAGTPARLVEILDLPFDDSDLPYAVFERTLPKIGEKLGFKPFGAPMRKRFKGDVPDQLPGTLLDLARERKLSPVAQARYLQLLGLLSPRESIEREFFFERSLVLMRQISEDSPAYRLLSSRALFHLYRRPAAMAILDNAKTPEERYFLELANGNLPEAMQLSESLQSPVLRLMAEIELSDLAAIYQFKEPFVRRIPAAVMALPQWRTLVERRLGEYDGWALQDNMEIKQLMDDLFPVSGRSSQDLAFGKMVLGQFDATEIGELSPYYHYRDVLEKFPQLATSGVMDRPCERDILFLLEAIGEDNTLRRVFHGFIQGNPESVIRMSDSVQEVFAGHPTMLSHRGWAIEQLASGKNKTATETLTKQGKDLKRQSVLLAQGQTWRSSRVWVYGYRFYGYDFPRRAFWPIDQNPDGVADRRFDNNEVVVRYGNIAQTAYDRKGLLSQELTLAYTQTDFAVLKALYTKLKRGNQVEKAARFLESCKGRFHGHPDRVAFMALLQTASGNMATADSSYEAAIKQQPLNWKFYDAYFRSLLSRGDLNGAVKVAKSYPPFSMSNEELLRSELNRVGLSSCAYAIGRQLRYLGWVDEAEEFLELAAHYQTGSSAEMWSNEMLALSNQDFRVAAGYALSTAQRYNQASAYAEYMELLHVTGFHREAEAVLPTLQKVKDGRDMVFPVILGMQMAGADPDALLQWMLDQDREGIHERDLMNYFFRALVTDRVVDKDMLAREKKLLKEWYGDDMSDADRLANAYRALVADRVVDKDMIARGKKLRTDWYGGDKSDADQAANARSQQRADTLGRLIQSLYAMETGMFAQAYSSITSLAFILLKDGYAPYSSFIPSAAWCASKSGDTSKMKTFLTRYAKEAGKDFNYYLAKAYMDGGLGRHDEAVDNLKLARCNCADPQFFPARYMLLEACERLFESTGQDVYRKLMLDFARAFQRASPMSSWTYTFVAKYSDLTEEKLRCLGISMYLDRNSARLAGISSVDKKRAENWMKTNNPFLKATTAKGQVAL